MRSRRQKAACLSGLALLIILTGCTTTAATPELAAIPTERPITTDNSEMPEALADLLQEEAGFLTSGADRFEVWVCVVPTTTTVWTYQPNGLRLDLDPHTLTSTLNATVTDYFLELSSNAYQPQFIAGGTITLGQEEGPNECFAHAIDHAGDAPGVLAIANAEHRAGESGGFGTSGSACAPQSDWPCPASSTGRGVYLGASDFHPDWGDVPAVDLLEHEIGHVLGWPHSGQRGAGYASALDLMSNSAAPREADTTVRNAQGTLAINRLTAGWIPETDVLVIPDEGATVTLMPSQGGSGARIAIVPLGPNQLLTVEYIESSGLQKHLPESGITVTLVDSTSSACATTDTTRSCRVQESLVGVAPFDDLLSTAGESWEGSGWRVAVTSLDNGTASLSVHRI